MGYSYPEHAKLLPFCQGAPRSPHPDAWLVGITQIAHHLGTNTRQARKKIACGEVFAIEVNGVLYGNRTWCPNTWYASCAADPNDPGFPLSRAVAPPNRIPWHWRY
ncbi:hypothetical protein [Trichloromonas sp.]|uniref:hypothetical protein n=1 Tax=Trichloromonas sp. TaxID=3069249 RepID=UPI001D4341BD|nr:hypothetical protein [Desulfuromonadaceae bacterium]MDY0269073.1 hypothetical protein [Trichloromonas sp.]